MKYFYIVNLTIKRLFILVGVLFILLGVALWVGIKLGQQYTVTNTNDLLKREANSDTSLPVIQEEVSSNNIAIPTGSDTSTPYNEVDAESTPEQEDLPIQPDPLLTTNNTPIENTNTQSKVVKQYSSPVKRTPIASKKQVRRTMYTIQIGAYAKELDANKIAKELSAHNIDAYVERGIRFYYTRVGENSSKEALTDLLKKVKEKVNIQGIIIKK